MPMKFPLPLARRLLLHRLSSKLSSRCQKPSMASLTTLTLAPALSAAPAVAGEDLSGEDDLLCCSGTGAGGLLEREEEKREVEKHGGGEEFFLGSPNGYLSGEARIERAWAHWDKIGQPKFIVAPMVDCSELPFRLLCRKYGAQAAYTPMLHSRIFSENEKYRSTEFTTCEEDRPLFIQFCANDPDVLLVAAKRVEPFCDYVDINLGCPQRIARRGNYGAFLMDNLPLVKSLVHKLATNLRVPVSCKIRIFPDLQDTINYARMLEEAGCSLLAVHGRTRDQKDQRKIRADWRAIRVVRDSVRIPVLANGNIRHMDDVQNCLEATGAEGVLSADALLENPALFAGFRTAEWAAEDGEGKVEVRGLDQGQLLVEYLKLCERYPVPWRMVRCHVHKMLGEWFRVQPQVREDLNKENRLTFEFLYHAVEHLRELGARIPLYVKESDSENVSSKGDVMKQYTAP